ncbi:MAG: methyltransferase [Thauera sp.]
MRPPPNMNHRDRFLELQALLASHDTLWRPPAFQAGLPPWCAERPALTAELRALDEATLEHLVQDPDDALRWLAPHLPALVRGAELCALPPLPARALPEPDRRLDDGVPGRKRAQIEAFAAHLPAAGLPLLEWCAGKGHLGRRLALADDVPVRSLEIDPALCAAAERLAGRSRAPQQVVCADALDPASRPHLQGHAVLALHACGELHRSLVRAADRDGAPAYAIAPCCYHRGADGGYRPLGPESRLALDAATLRLAVTETVTAPRHDRRRLVRDQAWKLGFIALRQAIEG